MGRRNRKKINNARLGQVLVHAVQMAEELFAHVPKSGPQKREWVIGFINEHIDLPWVSERHEAVLLGILVDVVVGLVMKRVL